MHPILFRIGSLQVHSYGFMLALAFIVAIFVSRWHLKDRFIDNYVIYDIVLAAAIGGIIGARIFYVIGNWSDFASHPFEILKFWNVAGLVFYGGLLGGALAVFLVIRWKRLPFWTIADMAGLSLALGLAITRVGCFLNGCCFGKESGLPWAVTFPQQTRQTMGILGAAVHPTQIYELLLDLALFIFLVVYRKKEQREGTLFLAFLLGYSAIRFFVEFFRAHNSTQAGPAFQILSLGIFLAALGVFVLRRRMLPEAG